MGLFLRVCLALLGCSFIAGGFASRVVGKVAHNVPTYQSVWVVMAGIFLVFVAFLWTRMEKRHYD